MTTTTTPQRTTDDPHVTQEHRRRPSRNALRLSLAALALSIGAVAVLASDGTAGDSPRSEWTSEDGLRWEHPDGRSYVVATPNTIDDR